MVQTLLGRHLFNFIFVLTLFSPAAFSENSGNPSIIPQYIDIHVHAAGLGNDHNGIFINPKLKRSFKFPFYLKAFGVTQKELESQGDGLILSRIALNIKRSVHIKKAVILALDGVVTKDGVLDYNQTQIYVPNKLLVDELPKYPELLFGASINPYRKDALERLDQVVKDGAVLLKWIPNIMHIDPADTKIEPFYRRLAHYHLPLLTHAGQERAFGESNDLLGDPRRLELPLSLGVTVIAAHIATTGKNENEDNFKRLLSMFPKYPNLYADISSLTQINKLRSLTKALEVADLHERLVYGSDWPLQSFPLVSPVYHLNRIGFGDVTSILQIKNQWDRDVRLKQALGVPASVFQRSEYLLMSHEEKREILPELSHP